MKILVYGEILWDIIEGEEHLGGAPLNFAAHVKKNGFESGIISALGKDDRGERAFEQIKILGVDISMVQRNDHPTGYVPVTLKDGQPDYEIMSGVAYDFIQYRDFPESHLRTYDAFYFGSLVQRNQVSVEALEYLLEHFNFREIFYDVNFRKDCYNKVIINNSLSHCTILKVNDEEVEEIGRIKYSKELDLTNFCEVITHDYPQIHTIIITAGSKGCYIFHKEIINLVPTEPVNVVDAVGAGDSFSAAFICALSRTGDTVRSAEIANKVGGYVASQPGPIPEYSAELLEELERLNSF